MEFSPKLKIVKIFANKVGLIDAFPFVAAT
jgi:hypothetical protein